MQRHAAKSPNFAVSFVQALLLSSLVFMQSQASFAGSATATAEEIKLYANELSVGGPSSLRAAESKLKYSGISAPEIFDPGMERLKATYTQDSGADTEINSWLAKTIALSGNRKYAQDFQRIMEADDTPRKLKKFVKVALDRLEYFATLNPQISAGVGGLSTKDAEKQRIKNALQTENGALVKIAAKRLNKNFSSDDVLLKALENKLLGSYAQSFDDKAYVDALAWCARVLADSGRVEFKATLETIGEKAEEKKLRRYAKKYAEFL